MVRLVDESVKRYITNKPAGLIRAFRAGKITEKQLRGYLKGYANIDEGTPIEDVIKAAEKKITHIRMT